ncbi:MULTISPECIES: transporter substrate-binding domain-containing protein [unclassified Cupriavidus]|uniref:transporter substrate-binding domain-containing protein n=1 Tax=Cupriavidus TaxID=106589 RepID=UPI0022720E4C|nr:MULTISPECIES: transporter substrate-binding domain-containing protein [unclassified Cupriavidus]MCY0858073.1 transporter substrate-binding domain-containing protein [Cupriavidus sp. D39]MDW3683429.1 transporter substrate-binding domain-containing protein [Cupriavidus sp. CV2]
MRSLRTGCLNALFAVSLLAAGAAAQAADLLDTVKQAGALKIGLEGTYPPFNYRGSNNQLEGFDVDVAKGVAAKLGVKPEFVTTEWSGIIAGLQAGKFDVIVNQVAVTPQRKQVLDFSTPYVYSAAQLIQRKDDNRQFKSLEDLKGKKLGVSLGSNYNELAKSVPGIDVKTYPGAPEYLRDLAAQRVDAALNDRLMISYLIKMSNLPLRPGAIVEGGNSEVAIPFRKDNPKFAQAIDRALDEMRKDGSLGKLSVKWFGGDVTKPAK